MLSKKVLIDKIQKLKTNEKKHILDILLKHTSEYSKNSNGYFFNLELVPEDTLNNISKMIEIIESRRETINNLDHDRDEKMEFYKSLLEDKLKTTELKRQQVYLDQFRINEDINHVIIKKKTNKKVVTDSIDIKPKKIVYRPDTVHYRLHKRMASFRNKTNHRIKKDSEADLSGSKKKTVVDLEEPLVLETLELGDEFPEEDLDLDEHQEDQDYQEEISEEISYYKKLLAKNGFTFDYGTLVKEDYIS